MLRSCVPIIVRKRSAPRSARKKNLSSNKQYLVIEIIDNIEQRKCLIENHRGANVAEDLILFC